MLYKKSTGAKELKEQLAFIEAIKRVQQPQAEGRHYKKDVILPFKKMI